MSIKLLTIDYATSKEGFCLSDTYKNNNTKMLWKCKKQHIWESTFRNVRDHWCPDCFNNDIRTKHTWADVLEFCKKYNIVFVNCPENISDKVFDTGNKQDQWIFQCFCGKVFSPIIGNIIKGNTTSCGCIKSKPQEEINTFINSLGFTTIYNTRKIISPLELDIYIPEKNIAIEHCGLYHHGEKRYGKEARMKHILKLNACKDKQIRLITIFEDEWKLKKQQVIGYLTAIMGKTSHRIFARKCDVMLINNKIAKQFHNDNHIQGHSNGKHIGLYFNNELVCLATFAKCNASRHLRGSDSVIELVRYTNKISCSVAGGLGKLLKYFLKQNTNIKEVISYSDNRWSEGNIYKTLGFTLENTGTPSYYYFKHHFSQRYHRYNFTKHKVLELFGGDPNKDTEWDIMSRNDYDRIWDCGSSKWILKKS